MGVYEGGFSLQATLNVFSVRATASLYAGGSIDSPNVNAFFWGYGLGIGIDFAIAALLLGFLWTGNSWWGQYVAAAALFASFAGAVYLGLSISSDPSWRSGFFLGLFVAALVFAAALLYPPLFALFLGELLIIHDPVIAGTILTVYLVGIPLAFLLAGTTSGGGYIALAAAAFGSAGLTATALYEWS